jgi:hypothetical protein
MAGSPGVYFASSKHADHRLIFQWNYGLIAVPLKEAGVAKLADAPDLGSGPEKGAGSSPVPGINDSYSGDCIAKMSQKDHSVKQVSRAKIANPVPDPFENLRAVAQSA